MKIFLWNETRMKLGSSEHQHRTYGMTLLPLMGQWAWNQNYYQNHKASKLKKRREKNLGFFPHGNSLNHSTHTVRKYGVSICYTCIWSADKKRLWYGQDKRPYSVGQTQKNQLTAWDVHCLEFILDRGKITATSLLTITGCLDPYVVLFSWSWKIEEMMALCSSNKLSAL